MRVAFSNQTFSSLFSPFGQTVSKRKFVLVPPFFRVLLSVRQFRSGSRKKKPDMWLRIHLFPDRPGLLAVVGQDGNIHFRTQDLGRFLGYSNIFSFGKRHGKACLYGLVPWRILPKHAMPGTRFGDGPLAYPTMGFHDLVKTIRDTRRNHMTPFGEDQVRRLHDLWIRGTVALPLPVGPNDIGVNPKYPRKVVVCPAGQEANSFQNYLSSYVRETLEWYESRKYRVDRPPPESRSADSTRAFADVGREPSEEISLEPGATAGTMGLVYDRFESAPDRIEFFVRGEKFVFVRE